MSYGQVVLLGGGGLDDDAQALHAVDGDAVTAGQEHCRWTRQVLKYLQLCDQAEGVKVSAFM